MRYNAFRDFTEMRTIAVNPISLMSMLYALTTATSAATPDSHITVDAAHIVNSITPLMYGSCIEDVNHEIYGGLYDQRLFGESFEEPAPSDRIAGWTAFGGSWHVDGDTCRVNADAGAKMIRDTPDLGDATVEADVQFPTGHGDNAGLLVHVASPGIGADNFDGYEVSISPSRGRLILGKHTHDWHPLHDVPLTVEPSQWIHLRVETVGARLRIFVDDAEQPLIDYTDRDHPLLSGHLAIRTWNCDASFRNVIITTHGHTISDHFTAMHAPSVSGLWDPISTGKSAADFLIDPDRPFNGKFSQRIQHGPGIGRVGVANRGLARWGVPVKAGQSYDGRLALRANDLRGPVTIALQSADGHRTYASHRIDRVTSYWSQYAISLTSNATDPSARFAVWIDQPGTVWVDQAVLMDDRAHRFHGLPIRADIGNAIVDGGVTFLRYGGTMVNAPDYRWKNMIGDPDKRPPYNGHWYPYSSNSFGIFDFLNFCEAAHIHAAFAINAEETDQDAADLADYLTGSTSTTQGQKRDADGHPAPYDVDYIEIGNEEVIWSDNPADYAHYAARFKGIAQAIHGRNPTLKLVCAAWWAPQSTSMKTVFDAVNGQAAAWDLHVMSDDIRSGDSVDQQLTQMQSMFKGWDPTSSLKCVIFEENGGLHNLQRALGHATTLAAAIRHGDFVLADCPANCLQPMGHNDNGWDQGQIFFTPTQVWGQPPYYAQQMLASAALPSRVESTVDSPGHDLDVLATRTVDGKSLTVTVVNRGSQAHTASLDLSGFTPGQETVRTLRGSPDDVNSADAPTHITPSISTGPWSSARTFAPYSVTTIQLLHQP